MPVQIFVFLLLTVRMYLFISFIMLGFSTPFSVFQIRNWKHLTNRKVQEKKAFWHVISTGTCATLCVRFSSRSKAINIFPKHILKSKVRDQSIHASKKFFLSRDSKKLFVKRFVKVFDQNRMHVEAQNQGTSTPADLNVPG